MLRKFQLIIPLTGFYHPSIPHNLKITRQYGMDIETILNEVIWYIKQDYSRKNINEFYKELDTSHVEAFWEAVLDDRYGDDFSAVSFNDAKEYRLFVDAYGELMWIFYFNYYAMLKCYFDNPAEELHSACVYRWIGEDPVFEIVLDYTPPGVRFEGL